MKIGTVVRIKGEQNRSNSRFQGMLFRIVDVYFEDFGLSCYTCEIIDKTIEINGLHNCNGVFKSDIGRYFYDNEMIYARIDKLKRILDK